MRVLGLSIPLIVLIIGAYLIGTKFPSIGNKVLGAAKSAAGSVAA